MQPRTGKGRNKTRNRELALEALLTCGSLVEAAARSNIAPRTLHKWLKQADFVAEYQEAKRRILDGTITKLRNASTGAVDVLVLIAHDAASPQSSRVASAKAIIQLAINAGAIEDLESRLQELESRTIEGDSSDWGHGEQTGNASAN